MASEPLPKKVGSEGASRSGSVSSDSGSVEAFHPSTDLVKQNGGETNTRSNSSGHEKFEYSGWVYHLGVNSIGHEYCHFRYLRIRGKYVQMYKRDPHDHPGIKPIRKGAIGQTLMVEESGRRKDLYVLSLYNRLDESKKGEIACATAGDARKWMEAFDHAKQQVEYESGALMVVLYEGPMVISSHRQPSLLTSQQSNWIVGGGLLATAFLLMSLWDILQAKIIKEYPAEFILVFWYNVSSFLVSLPVGIVSKPDLDTWKLSIDIQFTAVLFSGVMGTAFGALIKTWGLRVKGPVYVAMFKPLSIAMAAIMGVILLGDNLYLGCVVGSFIISLGFYTVMWGKITEEHSEESTPEEYTGETSSSSSSHGRVPLLNHYIVSDSDVTTP